MCLAEGLAPLKHGQHELAVLHGGHGFRRLPAEKFLHLVPVVVVERGELARQARQEVNGRAFVLHLRQ